MATQAKTETQPVAPPQVAGGLLDEILAETKIKPTDEAYGIARKGVAAFAKDADVARHTCDSFQEAAYSLLSWVNHRTTATFH